MQPVSQLLSEVAGRAADFLSLSSLSDSSTVSVMREDDFLPAEKRVSSKPARCISLLANVHKVYVFVLLIKLLLTFRSTGRTDTYIKHASPVFSRL